MATSTSLATLVLFWTSFISHTAASTHDDTFYECMPGMPGPGGKLNILTSLLTRIAESDTFLTFQSLYLGATLKKLWVVNLLNCFVY